MKITSPVAEFTGETSFGRTTLLFKDGVATTDKLDDGVRAYLLGAGYKVGSEQHDPITSLDGAPVPDDAPIDSRDFADPTQVGSKVRDAAVDPHEDDFLAPTNAGLADPHGPDVVSPEVHASQGVRPVKPGDVGVDDLDAQDAAETQHAADATDGTPVDDGPERPAGNASAEAWQEYDRAKGGTGEGSRDELRAKYSEPAQD